MLCSHPIGNWASSTDVATEELLQRRVTCDTEDQEEYMVDLISDRMFHEGELVGLPELPEQVRPECSGHITVRNDCISHMVLGIFLHHVK